MTRRIQISLVVAATAVLFATTATATSMRCGSHIISSGQRHAMGKYEVLKRCGEPTVRQGNTWIYDEPGKMRRVLRFGADGMLSDINTVS